MSPLFNNRPSGPHAGRERENKRPSSHKGEPLRKLLGEGFGLEDLVGCGLGKQQTTLELFKPDSIRLNSLRVTNLPSAWHRHVMTEMLVASSYIPTHALV